MFWAHVSKQLSAYCHGELPAEESRRVAAHLETCARCRVEYDEVRLGVQLASHLSAVSAPAALWEEIEARLDAGEPADARAPRAAWFLDWRALGAVAAVLMLGIWIGATWLVPRNTPGPQVVRAPGGAALTPVSFDLSDYLRPVQAAPFNPPSASVPVIADAPPKFEGCDYTGPHGGTVLAHLLKDAAPLPGFRLVTHRHHSVPGGEIVQLVYEKKDEAFSVFLAPRGVQFRFGKEVALDTVVDGIACRKVDCPYQRTYEFGAGGVKSVLVSKSLDTARAATVMNYFLAAYRQPE